MLVTDSPQQQTQWQNVSNSAGTLFTAASDDEASEFLQLTKIDIVAVALESRHASAARLFEQAKTLHPHCVTLLVAAPLPEGIVSDEGEHPPCDFILRRPYRREALAQTLAHAIDKQELLEEIAALRQQNAAAPPPAAAPPNGNDLSMARLGQILRDFTKAFSTNFDLQSALEQFLDALGAFLRPSRMSILIRHPHQPLFEIKASRGLVEKVAQQIRLLEDDGLPRWLITEARILQRAEIEHSRHVPAHLNVFREMEVLKAAISLPLMASGKLVGILNLGERITGGPYTDHELDIVFSLASQVAVGIQDIALYHKVQMQKNSTEKILRYMSSGLITIDTQEKIQMCNHRAAEIFGMTWDKLLHEDLRSLPSPLGDILYETLHDGVNYSKEEVIVAGTGLCLEVNTYQILDEHLKLVGGAMVFHDLTSHKALLEERRRVHQLEFLNKIAERMAHEIKNSLVSIRTFIDLLDEHYDDADYRRQFHTVAGQDVQAINVLTEKLVGFAGQITYHFEPGCVNDVLAAVDELLGVKASETPVDFVDAYAPIAQGGAGVKALAFDYGDDLPRVRFDAEHLHKACLYIVAFLSQVSKSEEPLRIASYRGPHRHGDVRMSFAASQVKVEPEDMERLFDPFASEHRTLMDVGPYVSLKIIEEHGGRLDVEYKANRELVFVISLPPAESC